jgi:hypothetical protein
MRRTQFLCFAVALIMLMAVAGSCGGEKKPDYVLNSSEMAKALTELYIQEARINRQGISVDSARTVLAYYQKVYAKDNSLVDSALSASYQYYLNRPKELSKIYDMVIDTLALREQRFNVGQGKYDTPQ